MPGSRLVAKLLLALAVPLALASGPSRSAAATPPDTSVSFFVPSAAVIERLDQRSRGERWYLTTPAAGYLIRRGTVGSDGLSGFTAAGDSPVPASIGWTRIARIDQRTNHRGTGMVLGAVAGAFALGYAGAAIGQETSTSTSSHNDAGAFVGIGLGTIVGGWLGGRLGQRWEGTRALYVGIPRAPGSGTPGPVVEVKPSAIERVRPYAGDPMRVEGSFGYFEGRVGTITPEGLGGLQSTGQAAPTEPVPWSQVFRIERQGSQVGRGAAIGAISIGAVTAALAAAAVAGNGGDTPDVLGGVALGALGGVIIGAPLGALVGSQVLGWQEIYRSPALAARAP